MLQAYFTSSRARSALPETEKSYKVAQRGKVPIRKAGLTLIS